MSEALNNLWASVGRGRTQLHQLKIIGVNACSVDPTARMAIVYKHLETLANTASELISIRHIQTEQHSMMWSTHTIRALVISMIASIDFQHRSRPVRNCSVESDIQTTIRLKINYFSIFWVQFREWNLTLMWLESQKIRKYPIMWSGVLCLAPSDWHRCDRTHICTALHSLTTLRHYNFVWLTNSVSYLSLQNQNSKSDTFLRLLFSFQWILCQHLEWKQNSLSTKSNCRSSMKFISALIY